MTHKQAEWQKATDAIHSAQKILIVTHVDPDGDAIGSAMGLANALIAMGKDVTVADDDGVPKFLQWLPNAQQIVTELTDGQWDVMISSDASDEPRTGAVGAYGRANSDVIINLDHHVTNTYFGDIHLVVTEAVSSTEIVFDWWKYIGLELAADVAVPLLTGLVTDTIGFRISSVTDRTLAIAQSLMRSGASLPEVTARTLDSRSYQEASLWKQVLPSMQLHGEVVEVVITRANLAAVGMTQSNSAGLVSFLNQINEARVSITFTEESDAAVKISMRAKLGYDVSEVAFALGGGGHKQASGATVAGTIDEVRAQVLPMLQAAAAKGKLEIA